jgi:hypothetical protein
LGSFAESARFSDAARCLEYSRSKTEDYDSIAFVFGASHKHRGQNPFASVRKIKQQHAAEVERIRQGIATSHHEHRLLAHRVLELPEGVRWNYTLSPEGLLTFSPKGRGEEEWIFSVVNPPALINESAAPKDAARHPSA